jgi:hypothetical protein
MRISRRDNYYNMLLIIIAVRTHSGQLNNNNIVGVMGIGLLQGQRQARLLPLQATSTAPSPSRVHRVLTNEIGNRAESELGGGISLPNSRNGTTAA